MSAITDDVMTDRLKEARQYCLVILKHGPHRQMEGADLTIWEHGRRNLELQRQGLLPVICPVSDGSDLSGIVIFNAPLEETHRLMEEDPGVKAGVFIYEVHVCLGFPGDRLP